MLPAIPRFVKEIYEKFNGINSVTFIQIIRVKNDLFDLSKELLDPKEFLEFIQQVALLNLYGLRVEILNNPLAQVVSKIIDMPWIPRSQALQRPGDIFITANQDITLSHSSLDSFGKYAPGKIAEVLNSKKYSDAVAPDEKICPACKYYILCKQNGMVHPSEWFRDMNPGVLYCKRVLNTAYSQRPENRFSGEIDIQP
jgi:hypothetical protein